MKLQELHESKVRDNLAKEYGITKFVGSTGLNEKKGKWYGWSHRAVFGYKIEWYIDD